MKMKSSRRPFQVTIIPWSCDTMEMVFTKIVTAEIGSNKPERRTVPTSQTLILKKIAEVKRPGVDLKKDVIMSNSKIVMARGDLKNVQKSNKGADLSRKVSEMRIFLEHKPLQKSKTDLKIPPTD